MADNPPPNMTQTEYDALKDMRERIPSLTPEELQELKRLNALSVSHLHIQYAR